ncbi:hypothetical protein [Aliivibrio sp. 1S128]|uniref:hypothetical protein n=1 Tax=Aliivibrio sp. 1S128 TaxID=1840085 RepID=UPI00080DA62B|nr:hypothetical protein [Aliivibrio sp. 1S128]OCH15609.1 hypothetical protein A6E03_02845 [Aliivibrio sp. 1S128]
MKILITGLTIFIAIPTLAYAAPLVTPNEAGVAQDQDYYTQDVRNTRLIFTEENKQHAEHAAGVESILQPAYEDTFGYQMDDRLNVGLMSSYNQIANGFSTQFPLNRQINYMGGAQLPDYFSSSSWLDTLLFHETAHDYQMNAKDNVVSKSMFAVLHNGSIGPIGIIPAVLPNSTSSSFMLEGNAVLNESWHGQGGRLYSGRYRAMTHVHAKAGNLSPERLYNDTLFFPYGESAYVFGSQYQYYLAETYGLDVTNKYFKNRSQHWLWPFQVNRPMKQTVGEDFDTTFAAWVKQETQEAKEMQLAQGKIVARSKYYGELNTQQGNILFLTNPTAVRAPMLVHYDLTNNEITKESSSLDMGKVYYNQDKYYTVSGRRTSVWRTTQGLFDNDAQIKEGSEGRVHQGYMNDGKEVYFKTTESFVQPQLYVGDQFYSAVNSSVLVKNDNLYYFVQKGNDRTLYRNKEAILTLPAFYTIVKDVDSSGRVYFIANTETGSSLYRTKDGKVERVLNADNVIDARLINDDKVLATAISADDYYYVVEDMAITAEAPYQVTLFWDDKGGLADQQQQKLANIEDKPLNTETSYGLFNNIHYTRGALTAGAVTEKEDNGDSKQKLRYNATFEFSDPLQRSTYSLWAMNDDEYSDLIGAGFSNNQFFIMGGVRAYYVLNDNYSDTHIQKDQTRNSGIAAQLRLPFLQTGFWNAEISSNFYQDYKLDEREPLSAQLDISRTEHYGNSWLLNKEAAVSLYGVQDRHDMIHGASLSFGTDLPSEFYINLSGKYSASDTNKAGIYERRGVELTQGSDFINNDPSSFIMPSLKDDAFAETASLAELTLSKVINLSAYSFKGPISLRREMIEFSYRRYDLGSVNTLGDVDVNQGVVGLHFDTLIMNALPIGFYTQYIHNDDNPITDKNSFQAGFSVPL